MEATELRLGNYVISPDGECEVTGIGGYETQGFIRFRSFGREFQSNIGYYLDVCEPISLDEKWLLMLGFQKRDVEFPSYTKKGIQINYIDGKWVEYARRIEVKTVHQLQNLFHSLAGEELTIKQLIENSFWDKLPDAIDGFTEVFGKK